MKKIYKENFYVLKDVITIISFLLSLSSGILSVLTFEEKEKFSICLLIFSIIISVFVLMYEIQSYKKEQYRKKKNERLIKNLCKSYIYFLEKKDLDSNLIDEKLLNDYIKKYSTITTEFDKTIDMLKKNNKKILKNERLEELEEEYCSLEYKVCRETILKSRQELKDVSNKMNDIKSIYNFELYKILRNQINSINN